MTMAGVTFTVAFCTFLCFEATHGFPVSDNTLFVSTSADAKTWAEAQNACSTNEERLASVRTADIKPKLQDEKEGTKFWVSRTNITKNARNGQCPVVYYQSDRLYLKHLDCSQKQRYICMPHTPTDFSLMIYIGVGCITLAQIFLITVCAVKLSKKKDTGTQQIKKKTQKEKPEADKASKEKSKEDKPDKEKSKKEKIKKPKSERKEKKSKKKANKGKDKDETQGIEADVKPGIQEGKEDTQGTETNEQKSGIEEGKGETKGTETNEQKCGIEDGKEETKGTETNEQKLVTDVSKEQTEGQEQKPSEEGGMDVQKGSEAKPEETEVAKDKEEKPGMETNEQKSETTVNLSAGEVQKETPLGSSASGTASGDGAAKSEFPDPPEFLLSELTSSFLAGTSIANIVSGTSSDDILSSKTTGDGLTASADVTETTFSTTATTTVSDVSTSPPVDVVAVTDVTADINASTECASAPVADFSRNVADPFGFGTAETSGADISNVDTPAGDEMTTSGGKKLTEAGFLDDNGAMFLPDPPKFDEIGEVIPIERPDPNELSEDKTQDEINV